MIINPYVYSGIAYDPDAQAFIAASGISGTNATAINQLVLDLKSALIWTKMKALYPIVGGTAATHKWNLKNPLDTDAAFRLNFSTGWTHSSNGMLPNGTSAFANTFLIPSTSLSLNNVHISHYSRTDSNVLSCDIGCQVSANTPSLGIFTTSTYTGYRINDYTFSSITTINSFGFKVGSRNLSTTKKMVSNSSIINTLVTSTGIPNQSMLIGAYQDNGAINLYSARQCAFASIGDGLTDAEAALLYQITEKYQVTLGRNINATQSFYYNGSYDNDTNVFLFNAQITDTTQQTAVNTLVSDLKSANIWTKFKAIYPIVGGTSTTHKWNLKDPRDLDAAFRLTFSTGWTHSSTGMLPATAYADTFIVPNTSLLADSKHLSFYSRTNLATGSSSSTIGSDNGSTGYCRMTIRGASNQLAHIYGGTNGTYVSTETSSLGLYVAVRSSSTASQLYKNGSLVGNGNSANGSTSQITQKLLISAAFSGASVVYYDNKQCAFASIGDSLTAGEVTSFNTAVTTFQTTLGRNV